LSYVLAALFDFIVASSLLVVLMIYYRIPITVNALYGLPIMIVLFVFSLSMALLFSATQVRFRDIGMAVPVLLQLWMFATPIIYPLSAVPERWRIVFALNPLAGITQNFRQVILYSTQPDFKSLIIAAVISVVLLIASASYFKRVDATMADIV
jgi:lipopolysaccharide transport system permease protein